MFQSLRYYLLPFIFVILFMGYQISVYFFYLYFKNRDSERGLNSILLAYGLLISFCLTGIIIRTLKAYFISNPTYDDILNDITHSLVALGTLSFLLIIAKKEFEEVFNTTITKIIIIYTIIISILIPFVDKFYYSLFVLISVIIGYIHFTAFHLCLVKKFQGKARRRFIFIFLGEISFLTSILIRAEESLNQYNEIVRNVIEIFTIPMIILSLSIIFFGLLRFPVFLELNWKEKLKRFLIVNKESSEIVFEYDFQDKNNPKLADSVSNINKPEDFLYSKGLIAIREIIHIITKREISIHKVEQGDLIILIEEGEKIFSQYVFLLIVEENMRSLRQFLVILKQEFKDLYGIILSNMKILDRDEKELYWGFEKKIKRYL